MKFNKIIPELSVSDIEKSTRFYTKTLGFKVEYHRKESKFVFLSFQGSQIMLHQMNNTWETGKMVRPFGRGINLQIETSSISPIIYRLKQNNYALFQKPEDNWYRKDKKLLGCREFLVQDPDGYLLRFSQDIGIKPAKEK